jgi:phenylacetate-coenzyme A ligase PaaK-like adenylate-forming protein
MGSQQLYGKIFNIKSKGDFLERVLETFNYQFNNNPVYQFFIKSLRINPTAIHSIRDIPFLPVEFFRNHKIITGDLPIKMIFESSGTSGTIPGKHYVIDPGLYEESFLRTFRLFYGEPDDYLIVALLPSYTEREGSSLVYMTQCLIGKSRHSDSGFYKNNINELMIVIEKARKQSLKILLLGVSFALLDMAENLSPDLKDVVVMETGGMKGRRKELTRSELHAILKERLHVTSVHSEYGMTELLSQAYSKG